MKLAKSPAEKDYKRARNLSVAFAFSCASKDLVLAIATASCLVQAFRSLKQPGAGLMDDCDRRVGKVVHVRFWSVNVARYLLERGK